MTGLEVRRSASRALVRWCESRKLYVEEAIFLGDAAELVRTVGVTGVRASVTRGENEGYRVLIDFRTGGASRWGPKGSEFRGVAARALGSREEAWRVAGALAYLLEDMGLVGEVRRLRARDQAIVAAGGAP